MSKPYSRVIKTYLKAVGVGPINMSVLILNERLRIKKDDIGDITI